MRWHRMLGLIGVLWVVAVGVMADVPEAQRVEVLYLLDFVKQSQCVIERNGTQHDGVAAQAHITQKYERFRDDIRSTEDFIRASAAKSMMTGRAYRVRCPGQSWVTTEAWLLNALARYRQVSAQAER